ncbi:MAG: CinA family protein [Hyphomicrobiaceae bacterium]
MDDTLAKLGAAVGARLRERRETIAVSESSTGGLISAALLSVPGASAYFLGGAVVYTRRARTALLGITDEDMKGMRSASEPYATLAAQTVQKKHRSTWGLAETGATGPTGNRYGDPAGHTCIAVAGLAPRVITLRTGSDNRAANMQAFAKRALEELASVLNA